MQIDSLYPSSQSADTAAATMINGVDECRDDTAAMQAGDNETPVDGAYGSSQSGVQIDSLYLSSQSADTDAAAATMITGVDECRDDTTATQAGDNDTPVDGAHGSSHTGMQIDSLYLSSQSPDTDTAAAHISDGHLIAATASSFSSIDPIDLIDTDSLAVDGSVYLDDISDAVQSDRSPIINGIDECRSATQAGDDTPVDGAHGSSQSGMLIDSLYSSSQSADTAAAIMINGLDECRDDTTATQAGDYDTSVDGAHGSSQTGMQIDSLYSSSQSADTDTAAATMITGVDECRDDTTATQTGDNDTPVDGAYGSSHTGMLIDSLYLSSQSADTDTAAAHISDGHLIAASASIFNSIDPIDFIGNDSIAVDILLPT